jgi:hypothetical protein
MSYVGNVPTTAAFPFDQFSGNGSTTAFTLTYAPASTTSIIVSISGVVQNPNTYSVSGTTITFTPAPPSGTNNIAVLYLGLPVIGVASPGNTAYRTSDDFTATASQTTFTPSGAYTVGFLDVYRNGARLGAADFTATNGTTVVLANPCTAGDLVTIVYFTLVSIVNAMPQSGGTFTGGITAPTVATSTGQLYPLVSGTAVSASGTSVDFTGIPATAKRVTVMLNGVSLNGSANLRFQLGDSGGAETTGYVSIFSYNGSSNNGGTSSSGFDLVGVGSAPLEVSGQIVFSLLNSSTNTWTAMGILGAAGSAFTLLTTGSKSLSATLDRVRITTTNGTDTFDAGTINIMWE